MKRTTEADARAKVAEIGGPELAERLEHLDRLRGVVRPPVALPPHAPDRDASVDYDVVLAGGGLWSLLAPLLADRGLSVAVLERGRAAVAHREWNASAPELAALVTCGLLSEAELAALIVARYRTGTCRFFGGGSYPVDGVLDCAIDAGGLLAHGRKKAEAAKVTFLDQHELVAQASGPTAIALRVRTEGVLRTITARMLVDARGAASPFAGADLVCPTVGGVVAGITKGQGPREIDPEVGEILATVDPIEDGRQHVWEAFPGHPDQTTVYLFYYSRAREPASLTRLYARFFDTLPTYKEGPTKVLRPTFGFIPGWSRLSRAPQPPPGRIMLVGDAAARHSPLTYCGFGTTLRSLAHAADVVALAASRPGLVPAHGMKDAPIHAMTGALALMLASRTFKGNELNSLLDASFASLHAMGQEPYAELLRDELTPQELITFLRQTAHRHPLVWTQVMRGLGLGRLGRWSFEALRSLTSAGAA